MQHFVISFFILKRQFDIFSDILYIPSCPKVRKKLILIQVHVYVVIIYIYLSDRQIL